MANLPKIWKTVKRKKKRRQHSLDDRSMLSSDDGYPSEDSIASVADIPRGFELQFGTDPPPDTCFPDDAVSGFGISTFLDKVDIGYMFHKVKIFSSLT